VAFTTIGYGEYHPDTPAGRSIFVVWALLGVGTMTILISVLSEAYSYRYKNAMHTRVFDDAVKRYRMEKSRTSPRMATVNSNLDEDVHIETHIALSESETRVRRQLEALPNEILQSTQSFREHLEYFVRPHGRGASGRAAVDGGVGAAAALPEGMRELLDDITGERVAERIKDEIVQDENARRTLFRLSIEKALRRMIDAAEDALDSVKLRNNLVTLLHEQRSRHGLRHRHDKISGSGSPTDPDENSPTALPSTSK